jgi:hypothetical protein
VKFGALKLVRDGVWRSQCNLDDVKIILQHLEALIVARLFHSQRWLDRKAAVAIHRKLSRMGLQEAVPGQANTTRNTTLGSEFKLDLLMAFMGMFDPYDVPYILAEHGLIDKSESHYLEELLYDGDDPEDILRDCVQQAYYSYYNPSGRLN